MKKTISTALLLCAFSLFAKAQIITTISGTGTMGYSGDHGLAVNAELAYPCGVCVDAGGNVYIADRDNSRIRKVDTAGIITTVAGTGTAGYNGDSIAATAAELNYPTGVTLDRLGNLFISDQSNNRIRKVDASGIITTYAGSGTGSSAGDNGPATAAKLELPVATALDTSGNLFICEVASSRIRKVDNSGIITTVAGTGVAYYSYDGGAATASTLDDPEGIAVDRAGNLYISDNNSIRIRKVNTLGILTTICGDGTAGFSVDGTLATSAHLDGTGGIAIDGIGNVYFAEGGISNRIRIIDTSGILNTVAGGGTAGLGDGGLAIAAELNDPASLALAKDGSVYIADFRNHRVRYVRNTTGVNTTNKNVLEFALSPNPNKGVFTINLSSNKKEHYQVAVYSVFGEKVTEFTAYTNCPTTLHLDLAAGSYYLSVVTNEHRFTQIITLIK